MFRIPLRIQACKVFSVVVEKEGTNFVTQDQVRGILEALPNSLPIASLELFRECHDVMLTLVKSLYENVGEFMETIFEYTKNGITMDAEDQQYNTISINFWKDIACFEYEIKEERAQLFNSQANVREVQNICEVASDELTDMFATIIQNINPEDTEVEDPTGNPQLSMAATMALATLFKTAPDKVFPKLSALITEIKDQKIWTVQHSICLFIYVLTGKTVGTTHNFDRSVYSFIQNEFSYVCQCMQTDNQRLRETSMWVVSQVISRNQSLLADYDDSIAVIQQIISFFGPEDEPLNDESHPAIITRVISILYNICRSFRPTSYNSPLRQDESGLFDTIVDYLTNILQLPQLIQNPNIITHAYEALNTLYIRAPRNVESFRKILEKVMETINEVAGSDEAEDIKYYREAGLCSNISTLVSRINDEGRELFPDIIQLLFHLLDNQNVLVYEEALITVATIIIRTEEDSPVLADIEKLMDYIKTSLESNNSTVIHSSCILISDLFLHLKQVMEPYFNPVIQTLGEMAESDDIVMDVKPSIIHAIADVIYGIGQNNPELVEPLKDVFYDTLVKRRDCPYNVDTVPNIELANEFLEAVAHGFSIYGKLFFVKELEPAVEKSMLVDISKVSAAMFKVRSLNKAALKSALDMYLEYSHNCSRRNNVILNKGINHKIIDIAKNFKDLKEHASNVKRILGNT